jgi:hypothetical protein
MRRYDGLVAKRSLATHGIEFVRHVVPQVIRPIRSLWHEVIGFLFLSIAFLAGLSGFRVARNLEDPANLFRLIVTVIFVLIMAGFGISSFLRARKISRS